jgi:hypothetical protein
MSAMCHQQTCSITIFVLRISKDENTAAGLLLSRFVLFIFLDPLIDFRGRDGAPSWLVRVQRTRCDSKIRLITSLSQIAWPRSRSEMV